MAQTRFSGPVVSDNGFEGEMTATDLTTTGTVTVDGTTVVIADLPETDPEVVGQLWNNAGVLSVSAGPA